MTAAKYMLDTNTIIYVRDGSIARSRFEGLAPGSVVMSIVTYGELQFGVSKGKRKHAAQILKMIAAGVPPIPMGIEVAEAYGTVRAELEKRGETIGGNDLWIAAHALSAKLILVTNNEREFRRVPGLKVENWVV